MTDRHTVFLGLGTNLGDREANIGSAIRLIAGQIGAVERQSPLYRSEPWGYRSENMFVNVVVRVSTMLTPEQLLHQTQEIERQLGKTAEHATERQSGDSISPVYHDRPIDIDILLYDDLSINTPSLTIPHPLMLRRTFVMLPLADCLD